jgi:predicted RecA/RadA family phage recombinase
MFPIEWRYGDQDQVTFTAAADLNAGEPVAIGNNLVVIPPVDYKSGELASGSTSGVYEALKDGAAIAAGAAVYYNATNKQVTATATSNTFVGVAIGARAAGDSKVDFQMRQKTPAIS